MLGCFSTYMRVTIETVPSHKGKCQAVQNNVLGACSLLTPLWLTWSYSGQRAGGEALPIICFGGFWLLDVMALLSMSWHYNALRPVTRSDNTLEKPLLVE